MSNKISILKEIDVAIDALDESKIEAGLQALAELESQPIQAEDVKLFAARIKKLKKEQTIMKKPFKSMRIALVASMLLLISLTAYAANSLNLYNFQQGGRFVLFRSTEDISEQDAKEMVADSEAVTVPQPGSLQADEQDFSFKTLEEAQETLDMIIPLPAAMPQMQLDSATGSAYKFGEDIQKNTAWLTYGNVQERMMGITVTRQIVTEGISVTGFTTTDIDDGSLGKYQSASGIEFTTLSESDDTGSMTAYIATAMLGEYEYSLIFVGFDEAERQAIIDSTDLSLYQ